MTEIHTLVVGCLATNCYILSDKQSGNGIVVDPGDDAEYISDTLTARHITPVSILATHGHFDHILAAFALQINYGIPFYIHEADAFLVRRMDATARHFLGITRTDPNPRIDGPITDGQLMTLGAGIIRALHTPGHTPGSICLAIDDADTVLVGDTLFAGGSVGRTDHEYSRPLDLSASIDKILAFSPATRLLSGHGEATTVSGERLVRGI